MTRRRGAARCVTSEPDTRSSDVRDAAGAAEESIYRVLLEIGGGTVDDLRQQCPQDAGQILATLDSLAYAGLVQTVGEDDACFVPMPLDRAFDALLIAQVRELEQTRVRAAKLAAFNRSHRQQRWATDIGEELVGSALIRARLLQLQAGASQDLCALVTAPFLTQSRDQEQLRKRQLNQLAQGVRYRVVYDKAGFAAQGGLEVVLDDIAAGEEARIADRLQQKLLLVDHDIALISLRGRSEPAALVVHEPSILTAVRALFERVWEHAVPLAADHFVPRSDVIGHDPLSQRLLGLLRAGFTEVTIARELGLSTRSVQRRMRALMNAAGAETRFQLGVRAVELGWISTPHSPSIGR